VNLGRRSGALRQQASASASVSLILRQRILRHTAIGISEAAHPRESLGEMATNIKLYGNASTHPDAYGEFSMPEAKDVALLAHTLIEQLYIVPARIARQRAQRLP
jgi:hypothetical protein